MLKPSEMVAKILSRTLIFEGETIASLAKSVGVSRPNLSNVIHGKAALSPKLTVKLEQHTGLRLKHLLLLQLEDEYDRAKEELNERV